MPVTVGFVIPGPGGDGTWVDGALTARRELESGGIVTETLVGMPEAIPAHWAVAVCHSGEYAPLLASRSSPDQTVIISDRDVTPPGTPAVTEIDWGWAEAFSVAGSAARTLVPSGREIVFIAGPAVPTQRALVDAFLSGLLAADLPDVGAPVPPVHVSYLPAFDDADTARAVARRALEPGRPVPLFVSSSDGAGLAGLALARAAGAPTLSFLAGLADGDVAAVVSDIPGMLTRLVWRALAGEALPARVTATLASGEVALRLREERPATQRAAPRP
jgi:hypothetical protein